MNKLRSFDFSVLKKLQFYVYVLIDPLGDEVFYVGKGGADEKGNQRLSVHFYEAEKLKAQPEKQSDKVKRILEIWRRNQDVKWLILRHGINTTEAQEVEAAVIDALKVFTPAFWQLEASDGIDVLIHHLSELGAT